MRFFCMLLLGLFSLNLYGQDCNSIYLMNEGKTYELTSYNKRGKVQGKQIMKVKEVTQTGGTVKSTVEVELLDDKNKVLNTSTIEVECAEGVFKMDMMLNIPQNLSVSTKMTSSDNHFMEFPANMKAGDNLKDSEMEMEVETGNLKQTIKMFVSNRKVEAKESVTTPAGTWDAFKISSTSKIEITTMGVKIPSTSETIDYYVLGFGVVKSENKSGYTMLTAIK